MRQIGLADSSLTHVSRAVRWITEHYNKPFRVEDLARSCSMSTSAFHRTFHAVTALSPIPFSREYRRQFGLPPGRDAVRLRAGAGAA